MTLQKRDKRALLILAVASVLILVWHFSLSSDEAEPAAVAPSDSIPLAEKRLAKYRQLAASLPARQQALQSLTAELEKREKGMIQAETAAQAQAQLLQILRRTMTAQAPPVEIRTVEMGQVRPLGEDYGEVFVPVSFECRIEQILNLLADLTAQREVLTTRELRISVADAKQKTMLVRLTVAGVVPRQLVPKKGQASL